MKTARKATAGKATATPAAATVLRIAGDMTIYQAEEVRQKLLGSVGAAGTAVEIDLQDVTEIDTAGVQLLIAARHAAAAVGKTLCLTARSAAVTEVLALFGLATFFAAPSATAPAAA
jgi:anti-anti-sigma factor